MERTVKDSDEEKGVDGHPSAASLESPKLVDSDDWKNIFCLHLTRLKASNVGDCKLLAAENNLLVQELRFGSRAAQFCVWRCTLLHVGAFFFATITVMDALFVADIWGTKGEESLFMRRIDPRYRRFFAGLNTCNWVQSIGMLVSSIVAVVLAVASAWTWRRQRRSRRCVFFSWLSSYLPPFLLLLAIPYRSSVDFEGIQQQLCTDMLNLTLSVKQSDWWPGKGGDLAQALMESYSISLPDDFCEDEPTAWGTRIRDMLTDNGFLARPNGTCGFSDKTMLELSLRVKAQLTETGGQASMGPVEVRVGTSDDDCPPACLNCTGVCRPHLLRLSALASIHNQSVLEALPLGGVAERCIHCVSRIPAMLCPFKCPDVSTELDLQAVVGMIPAPGRACFDEKQVTDLELLLQLGTQTAYWKTVLGTVYAALSLTVLLPLAFSLMLGAGKGAWIAKSIIPYSRVPDVISTSAAVFSFPFVFMIMILVQNAFGNWLTLIAIVLVLVAFLASMKPGRLKVGRNEMVEREDLLGKIGLAASVSALIIFLIVIFVSDLAYVIFNVLREQSLNLSTDDLKALGSQTTWTAMNTVCGVFGKSLISTVFFADSVVLLMYRFHKGEEIDSPRTRGRRSLLVSHLDTALGDNLQAVAPADEPRPETVTPADLRDKSDASEGKTTCPDHREQLQARERDIAHDSPPASAASTA